MILPLLLAVAQTAPASPPVQGDVIVIAPRLEKELAACLARNCPPAEEVEASLQASVEQFADGRYADARRTLQRAIRRNKDRAATMPGPISSLYATLATVAEHEGESSLWLASARNSVLTLRRHVGEAARPTLEAELAFGDNLVQLGQPDSAGDIYAKAQRLAIARGESRMAAAAAFRRAWLALQQRSHKEAESFANEAVALAGPDNRFMSDLRDIVVMRIALRRGDEGAVDALAARLRQAATVKPLLLTSPPVDDVNSSLLGVVPAEGIRFADVGYWIRPDGRTADAEVLRTSGLGQWGPGILKQIKGRRYVPLTLEAGDPGVFRIDRYTVRASVQFVTGTRVRQRAGRLSVHVVDLTETDALSTVQQQRTAAARVRTET
ncbi:hypothetical protein SAMN06297144_1170 [Sphingomonas guangdongensis]|uniref:Tetratricopeptide repeat-containing protein n=1 Tax=Sphingomonas guangdongensis TaxID=1141890 RepID=A0A285QFL0_9SPHN|nr:hypothetical protein [Sphingomonas guangdongensis]SOB80653.1 hypothetical protein SAMN06297144_1170 [Sphingomonas guangdongensis]